MILKKYHYCSESKHLDHHKKSDWFVAEQENSQTESQNLNLCSVSIFSTTESGFH